MRLSRAASMIALAAALGGCAAAPQNACSSSEQPAIHETLYFGAAKPDGVVTPADWAAFLKDTVTPRFPRGFTQWQASGQWRGADGVIVLEPSYALNIDHPDDAGNERAVREIMAVYKARFRQEAIFRARLQACTSFH